MLPLLYLPPLRMRRRGNEHLPATGPVLIVCNHVSVADPIVLMAAARKRRTSMISKAELFERHPASASFLHACGRSRSTAPSRPTSAPSAAPARCSSGGHAVVVFPEGHVSRSGHMRRGPPAPACSRCAPG